MAHLSRDLTACQYLAGIVHCTIEGEAIGARRTLTHADGASIIERQEALDDAAQQLSYLL